MTREVVELVSSARALLFVPGDRPERFAKAASSGAEVVVLDLEDAVAAENKGAALGHVLAWLKNGNSALVRVNGVGTPTHDQEVECLRSAGVGIMLPKAESVHAVEQAASAFGQSSLVVLIETALGIENAYEVCCVPGVARAAFGSVDLAAQLGVDPASHEAMAWARSRLVNASAAAGIPGPIDGVTTDVSSEVALLGDLSAARSLGFTGKLCIHPRQVSAVREALAPAPEDVAYAQRVVRAVEAGGVTLLEGQMIDAPVVARAQRILDAAGTD